jgi:hypothetical protein
MRVVPESWALVSATALNRDFVAPASARAAVGRFGSPRRH